jgi:hypothetical protein
VITLFVSRVTNDFKVSTFQRPVHAVDNFSCWPFPTTVARAGIRRANGN